MNLKKTFLKVFESMVVAWLWLLLLLIDIIFIAGQEPSNIVVKIFDRIVMVSCFLIYPFASNPEKSMLPFLYQFIFWWLFGAIMIFLYRKLSQLRT